MEMMADQNDTELLAYLSTNGLCKLDVILNIISYSAMTSPIEKAVWGRAYPFCIKCKPIVHTVNIHVSTVL